MPAAQPAGFIHPPGLLGCSEPSLSSQMHSLRGPWKSLIATWATQERIAGSEGTRVSPKDRIGTHKKLKELFPPTRNMKRWNEWPLGNGLLSLGLPGYLSGVL